MRQLAAYNLDKFLCCPLIICLKRDICQLVVLSVSDYQVIFRFGGFSFLCPAADHRAQTTEKHIAANRAAHAADILLLNLHIGFQGYIAYLIQRKPKNIAAAGYFQPVTVLIRVVKYAALRARRQRQAVYVLNLR